MRYYVICEQTDTEWSAFVCDVPGVSVSVSVGVGMAVAAPTRA